MHAREVLFIVELILWPPTLAAAIYVATKQGFSRQLGWFSLIMLGIFRTLGSATGIAAIESPSEGLIETSMICESVGLISLVGALTGLIFRVQGNMPAPHAVLAPYPFVTRLVHLATIAALILSILAGSDFSSTNSASDITQGRLFIKVAIGLLTGVFLVSGGLSIFTRLHQMGHITAPGEARLVTVCIIAIPFIAVRLIYGWLGACLSQGSIFGLFSDDAAATGVRAVMQIAVELIVAWLFLWAGFTVPKSARPHHHGVLQNDRYPGTMRQTRGGRTAMLRQGFAGFSGHANTVDPQQEQGVVAETKPAHNVQEV
jgi:hypothetical protein